MSREIKFRAIAKIIHKWDGFNKQSRVNNGDFVYGHYFMDVESDEDSDSWLRCHFIRIVYGDHYSDIEIDPDTLGEFTGLKDKNGTPIFEGDIVKHHRCVTAPSDYDTGEPAFLECEYIRIGHVTITPSRGVTLNGRQETRDYNEDKHISFRRYNENPKCWDEFSEVIGNIHENPELIHIES